MSEWYSCPHCYANRETGCACPNSKCIDGIPNDPPPDHIGSGIESLRLQLQHQMKELEAKDVTQVPLHDLIELAMLVNRIQSAGIDAQHACARMIRRWKERHSPQELRDHERYCDETSNRMSAPGEHFVKSWSDWVDYNKSQRKRAERGLTYYQVMPDCKVRHFHPDGTMFEPEPVAAPTAAILSAIDQTP